MVATRQQTWSAGAHNKVMSAATQKFASKYRTLCMKMPSLIKQAGLVQAIVFVQAREGDSGKQFVNDLAAVANLGGNANCTENGEDLLERVQGADLPIYLAHTNDVSQVAVWFRRFAQIELKDEDDAGAEAQS